MIRAQTSGRYQSAGHVGTTVEERSSLYHHIQAATSTMHCSMIREVPVPPGAESFVSSRHFASGANGDGNGGSQQKQSTEEQHVLAVSFRWRDPRTIPPRQWLYGRHYIRGYVTAT